MTTQHSEWQVPVGIIAVPLCQESKTRTSVRFKNLSAGTVYIGNGQGVTILTGYALEQNHELSLWLPVGDDTKQAYYAIAAAPTSVVFVMEQCCSACYSCPKVRAPED